MNRTVAFILVFVLGVGGGAFGYHVYLTQTPKAASQYVSQALDWADRQVDAQVLDAYTRNVFVAVEAALAESPDQLIPRDCTRGYRIGAYEVAPNPRIVGCSVHRDEARTTVDAWVGSGERLRLGPL